MPFEEGHQLGLNTRFSSEKQPELNGRPLGVKNRSTIARKVLEMSAILPDDMYERLKISFPDIEKRMTAEEIATLVILGKTIANGDFNAYKAIMDSAYGAPKAEIEHSGNLNLSDQPVIFK